MLVRRASNKKKPTIKMTNGISLDSSLTAMDWLPKMQIGENPLPSSVLPSRQPLPSPPPMALSTTMIQQKLEPKEIELPTSTVHLKPPYSYVTLIRQAILGTTMQRMTLNEIYQWILDAYPYFRTAPPKWKNSIRHNLSLNKCFKRLQRSSNDPGKGSYWAIDESNGNNHQSKSRRQRFDLIQPSLHVLPSSPSNLDAHSMVFHSDNDPMIRGDVSSVGGQSSSADDSDSTMSFVTNSTLIPWDDLTAACREQILDGSSTTWITSLDAPSTRITHTNSWNHDLLPSGEVNNFFESIKLPSSGEINWNDVDVKPYYEFPDSFRANSTLQEQDRNKLINLASSITSFFDYTGITNLAQNKITNDTIPVNRLSMTSNRTISETHNNLTTLPVIIDDESFDWESITQ